MNAGTRSALSMLIVGVLATLVLVSLPILVGGMIAQFHWNDRYAGWLGSADMSGSAIASMWAMTRIGRIDWQAYARRAIAVVIAGNLVSIGAQGLWSLLAARVVTGFGNGVILSIVFTGLCHARDTERLFGIYTFAQLVLQALALMAAPRLLDAFGTTGCYVVLAAAATSSALLVRFFPSGLEPWKAQAPIGTPSPLVHASPSQGRPSDPRAAAALFAQGIYFLAPGAVWAYLERIGENFSLSLGEVGTALAIASGAGLAGSGAVIAIGARLGNLGPMIAGTVSSLVAMWLLIDGTGLLVYVTATCLFTFAWNFTFPYQMSVLSRLDTTGTVATLSLLVQLCALAVGPLVASAMLAGGGYRTVLMTCVAAYILSLALFVLGSINPRERTVKQRG